MGMIARTFRLAKPVFILAGMLLLAACQTAPPPPPANRLSDAQETALKQEGFAQTEEGWEFSSSDKLLFDFDEYTLKPQAQQIVERIGRILAAIPVIRVRVDGHSDNVGTDSYNQQLSLRRAQTVTDALIASGMAPTAISVRGLGKSMPIANNQTLDGRQQNRRVAIVVMTD